MSNFPDSIEHYTKGIQHLSSGPCPGCDECGLADVSDMDSPEYQGASESSFSWSQCDGCGSRLGGDRFYAHGIIVDKPTDDMRSRDIIHLDVCMDCYLFFANGDEPEE